MQPGLDRYRGLVDDWDAFVEACSRPLPVCGWLNPLRPDDNGALEKDGFSLSDLPWKAGALRIESGPSMAMSIAYRAGLFHVQEEASLLPVRLLAPQAGERVLDLCAAPGNKSAEIATALGGDGTLIANDSSKGRLNVLKTTIDRLGLPNITITALDGRSVVFPKDHFDAVLVDAPCSCEGTLRKYPGIVARTGARERERLTRKQISLLLSALRTARPGGRVVYSTCSFAPEENEMVVDAALRARDDVRVEAMEVAGLASSPGVTSWEDRRLSAAGSLRLWPHRVDSGGFFAALLVKAGGALVARACEPAREPVAAGAPGQDSVITFLMEHFGIEGGVVGAGYDFVRSKHVLQIVSAGHSPGFRVPSISTGMGLVRMTSRVPKLTTQGALLLGHRITRQWVDLGRESAFAYMRGEEVEPQDGRTPSYGYVQVRCSGTPIGVGLFDPNTGRLESKYPRHWAGLHPPR